jgi:hypothetical protein
VIHFCRRCGSWLFSIVRNAEFAHVRNLPHLRRFQSSMGDYLRWVGSVRRAAGRSSRIKQFA